MPDPILPPGCVCHKCGKVLTAGELSTFSVTTMGGGGGYASSISISRKWGPHACGHKYSSSLNNEDWKIMLDGLTEPGQADGVREYVTSFYRGKKDKQLKVDEEESEKAGRQRKFWR